MPLALGTPYDGTLAGDAEAQLFRVDVPQSQQFLVSLQGISAADHVEVYARFGSPPTRDDTQYAATAPATTGEDVLVPMAAPGTWYILVYAETVGTPPEGFTLTAGVAPMTLASVSPARLGNADDATLTLTGAGFDPATTVSLEAADGTVYPAGRVQLDLPTQLTATFAAGSVPAGVYSVLVARSDGASATLAGAFTVEQAGQADFHINLVTPGELGYHIASTIYVQYSNTGNLAMPAPLVEVTIAQTHADGTTDQEALLTLDPSLVTQGLWTATLPAGFSNTIQFLASGANPGVLEPGESIQVPIYYAGWEQPWDNTYPDFQYEYGVEQTTDTTPIPWDTVQQEFQPADLDTTAWDAVLPGVETLVGNTWGDFVRALDDNASYLGHLGEDVTDIYQLWTFEIQQAGGLSPVKVLSSRTDLQVVTPGPALEVDREFSNYIDARSQLGPFGYGWIWDDEWSQTLSVDDGLVTLIDDNRAPSIFEPDSRGGYFSMAGIDATLTSAPGGGYLLQDSSGQVTAFGADGRVTSVRDANGNTVTAGYTGGLLTSLTASTGQSLTMAYNAAGRITSIVDSAGRTTAYAYDPTNQYLLSVTDFAGRTTTYTYDTSGSPTTENWRRSPSTTRTAPSRSSCTIPWAGWRRPMWRMPRFPASGRSK